MSKKAVVVAVLAIEEAELATLEAIASRIDAEDRENCSLKIVY